MSSDPLKVDDDVVDPPVVWMQPGDKTSILDAPTRRKFASYISSEKFHHFENFNSNANKKDFKNLKILWQESDKK